MIDFIYIIILKTIQLQAPFSGVYSLVHVIFIVELTHSEDSVYL